MTNSIIKYLSPDNFKLFKDTLSSVQNFDTTEKYGLTITVGDKIVIVLCNDPSLSKIEKQIILWHEKGHAAGYDDEADADKYAYRHVSDEGKEILRNNWKSRHGHEMPL